MTTENQRAARVIAGWLVAHLREDECPECMAEASELLDALADAGLVITSDAAEPVTRDV